MKTNSKQLQTSIRVKTKELKESDESLRQKVADLANLNAELEAFVYISSHDLQEPLRKIQNFVTILKHEEQNSLTANAKHYLDSIQNTSERMQGLIDDLLAYSRVKKAPRKFEKIDLNEVMQTVINDLKEVIDEKKATIEIGDLCEARIIPFQFRQLMNNLIGNSLKFSKKNRKPRIVIRSEQASGTKLIKELAKGQQVNLSFNTTYCHVSISDNGIGFNTKYKDRIFEIFQRLHEKDKYKGTGIGLAICKRIVENHNGIIIALGNVNKGARFDIYLPAK